MVPRGGDVGRYCQGDAVGPAVAAWLRGAHARGARAPGAAARALSRRLARACLPARPAGWCAG